ncbi:MAG: efflux RND transporter periplasmic adaptor subunit [Deltaproteobacteria bacterium]|jgi:membrane fusion protein (multidrug efflux system)|nr:efflux RND transporter periplasmic adaptor subunit [Deltaproteobacteria bacterium]
MPKDAIPSAADLKASPDAPLAPGGGKPGANQAGADKPGAGKTGGGKAVGRALAVFLVLGLAWLAYWFVYLRPYVSTDDAYVVGNQIRLSPRTSGTISGILFDNTQAVGAGEVVVNLDPTDAELALRKAREDLAVAVRQIASQKSELGRLAAVVTAREGDLALIEGEYQRRKNLKAGSSVTAEEVERYRQQTEVARANLEAAKRGLETQEVLVGGTEIPDHPQVRLALHGLKEAWLALGRCQVRSPAAGLVARRTAQVGSYVTPATNLMAIVPLGDVWVEANFKESQLGQIRPGHRALITADMYGGSVTYRGTVLGFSPGTGSVFSLLPAENATGNWIKVVQRVPVKILLDPADLADNPLLLGLSLRVRVNVSEAPGPVPREPELASLRAAEPDEGLEALEAAIQTIMAENLSPTGAAPAGAGQAGSGQPGPAPSAAESPKP